MRMRALYASNYFTNGPPARRFDNPYFIPSTQVLLQQLVNKGKAVTPTAVATPPARPTAKASSTATPAAPDKATPGAAGTAAPNQERKPPQSAPNKAKADEIQKKFNKAVADQKARAAAKADPFGKKQGVKRPVKDVRTESQKRADAIQKRFNKAIADQRARDKAEKDAKELAAYKKRDEAERVREEKEKLDKLKKQGKIAPAKAPAAAAPAAPPGPQPQVRDATYTNLSTFDAASLRGQVKERAKQQALYKAEGLKSSLLIKDTPKNMRGANFNAKMLKFRDNQGRINVKIRAANKKIQGYLDKAKKDKSTSRRIRPQKSGSGLRGGLGGG